MRLPNAMPKLHRKRVRIEKALDMINKFSLITSNFLTMIADLSYHPYYKQNFAIACVINNNAQTLAYYSISFVIN